VSGAQQSHIYTTVHRRKDGVDIPVEINLQSVVVDAGPPRLIAIARDITERKRMEMALQTAQGQVRQMQKMEALSRLAGGIAHDFNNLLTIILSQSELLLMALADREPALRRDVEEIHQAVRRGTALTRQLLTLSRRQPLLPQVLDLARLVADLAPMLHRVLGEQITLAVHTDSPGCSIMADPGQIEQVLLNLVINARDAMPEGGRLTLTVTGADLDESAAQNHPGLPPGRYVGLTVSDTGSGMDEETQRHLFEPFFTTKEKGKGTGLGLATVFGIVTQSGGHIACSSAPGQGTTFTLDFPCLGERAVALSEPTPASTKPAPGTETILLVEDDDAVRHATLRILCQAGYTVLDTASPLEALRLLEHHPTISLLLTDVVMPQMAGDELARRVKALHPAIPVIHMSGYTATAQLHDGRLPSSDAFLAKPFTADALLRAIREVLDNPT
jgi:signal transduction histidine kinase/ActR/RegA family two-component response regulator